MAPSPRTGLDPLLPAASGRYRGTQSGIGLLTLGLLVIIRGEATYCKEFTRLHRRGAVGHVMEPEVSLTLLICQELGVDALAIVPDPQSKLPLIVAQLHLNLVRLGVSECIAQRLTPDPIDLVTRDRVQGPRCAFHHHTQSDRSMTTCFGRDLLCESRDGPGQVIALDHRCTQPLHGLPSLGDRRRCQINRAPSDVSPVCRTRLV